MLVVVTASTIGGCSTHNSPSPLTRGPISFDGTAQHVCTLDKGGKPFVLGQLVGNDTKHALTIDQVTVERPQNLHITAKNFMSSNAGNIGVGQLPFDPPLQASWDHRSKVAGFVIQPHEGFNLLLSVKPIDASKNSSLKAVDIAYSDDVTGTKYFAKGTTFFTLRASVKCF